MSTCLLLLLAACVPAATPQPAAVETEAAVAEEPTEEAAVAEEPTEEAAVAEEPTVEAAVAEEEVSEPLPGTSGEMFDGQTVVVVGVTGDQGEYLKKAAAAWEEQTGATVELNLIPFGELQDKVATAVSAGAFVGDVLNIPAYMGGDLMGNGFIEPVPDEVKARLEWDDVMPLYQQQAEWGGVTYGYPWDGDFHSMYFRKDLIEDPDNQAAFKKKYGYDLRAPKTWDEYHDVAAFFTEDLDELTYGDVELIMRKNQGFHGFISRATCYSKMPDNPAFFFDPETMDAEINNPGFVKALEDLVAILPYAPPDMPNFGFMENAQAFVGGLVGLDIQWADLGPMSLDPKTSVVQGKVGFAPSPGCTQTWDSRTDEWVEFPDVNYAPYAAFGGWQNLVPVNAEAKEAAVDLAAYYASPDSLKQASLTGGSGVNPARTSTVEDVDAWITSGFSEEDAQDYLGMVGEVLGHPNAVFQLRLPGYVQYQDALELAVSKAIAGQATPQEALDEAAAEWNTITDRIGRDQQKALYRQSIGLE
jgi:multiple sugar transport system substrate-binding protein